VGLHSDVQQIQIIARGGVELVRLARLWEREGVSGIKNTHVRLERRYSTHTYTHNIMGP